MIERLTPYLSLIKAAAIVVAILAALWWWSSHNQAQQAIGYAKAAAEYDRRLAAAKEAAAWREQGWASQWERAIHDRVETEKQLAAARAAAVAADQRLRHTAADFRQRLATATTEAARAAAITAAELLGECSGEYQSLAAAADGHAADAVACRAAWPE
jgi:hypothetical protein